MKMSDGPETRTSVSEVINVVDEHFSTMIADACPIRSAWARKFEQLDSRSVDPWRNARCKEYSQA
ncbi:hypothetical protein O3684_01535 [Pauljensenia sp. 20925_1_27]